MLSIILAGLVMVAIIGVVVSRRKSDAALDQVVQQAIEEHTRTLRIQLHQRQVTDPYGNFDTTKANEHLVYFINNVIFRDLKARGVNPSIYANSKTSMLRIHRRITDAIVEDILKRPGASLDEVRTGVEYEFFCKSILEENDWLVITTPGSGDQGADLIARKHGIIVVLQCKFYSKPVGNKAVQEAYAAKGFQQADWAAVVSNAAFTKSARALAGTNRVLLLHHDELATLDQNLFSD